MFGNIFSRPVSGELRGSFGKFAKSGICKYLDKFYLQGKPHHSKTAKGGAPAFDGRLAQSS